MVRQLLAKLEKHAGVIQEHIERGGPALAWADEQAAALAARKRDLRWHLRFWWLFAVGFYLGWLVALVCVTGFVVLFVAGVVRSGVTTDNYAGLLVVGTLCLFLACGTTWVLRRQWLVRRHVRACAERLDHGSAHVGTDASKAELAWLIEHRWGDSPCVSPFSPWVSKHVAVGRFRGFPVMLSAAYRMRERRRNVTLTTLYVARAVADGEQLASSVLRRVGDARYRIQVKPCGISVVMMECNRRSVRALTKLIEPLTAQQIP